MEVTCRCYFANGYILYCMPGGSKNFFFQAQLHFVVDDGKWNELQYLK